MVASPATSSHDSETRQAADGADPAAPLRPASLSPSPSVALRGEPSSDLLSDSSLCPSLLDDLASPHHSLSSVAEKHNLSLSDLLAWLQLPSTREQMALRESACYHHVRYVAALNLSQAVHTTVRTLDAFNKSAPAADPLDPAYLRAAIQAHKAAWLLYRFSRLTPVTQADLDRARAVVRHTTSAARHTAPAAERMTPQPARNASPPSPAPPAAASPAQSPRRTAEAAPVAAREPTPTTPSAHAPAHFSAPRPANAPDPHDPPDMAEIMSQLTTLATSLGIDISDLEDLDLDLASDPAPNRPPGRLMVPCTLANTT